MRPGNTPPSGAEAGPGVVSPRAMAKQRVRSPSAKFAPSHRSYKRAGEQGPAGPVRLVGHIFIEANGRMSVAPTVRCSPADFKRLLGWHP
jgi:hypothetical protein